MFVLTSNFQKNKSARRLFIKCCKGEEHLFEERTNLFGSICNSMLLIFKCAYFSGLLLRVVHSAPFPGKVVYPRFLEARGLDDEKMLYIRGDTVLRLKKTSVLAERFVFSETINGARVDTPMDGKKLEANLFHDRKQTAAVTLEDNNGTVEVRGILNDHLRIAPLNLSARSGDGYVPHKIFQVEPRTDSRDPFKVAPEIKNSEDIFHAELKIVFDEHYESAFSTREELISYLATCVILINLRYQETSEPTVQFLLTGIERVDDMFLEYFIAEDVNCATCPEKKYLEPDNTINRLISGYGWGPDDITVLVTSMDLADRFGGDIKKRSAVMGASEFQGFCSEWKRIAIVEDTPATYSMIQLLAHELAHTLGATHDGIAPPRTATGMLINACPDQGYMMAPSAHGRNSGHFSICSIIQIREFIKTLAPDCRAVKSNETIEMKGTNELPGTNMSLTSYCKLKYPKYSNITAQNNTMSTECKFQCCHGGQQCFQEIAVDGMPCGDDKMCFRSKCVKEWDPFKKDESTTLPTKRNNKQVNDDTNSEK